MASSAQREFQRGNRLDNFTLQHREAARDPMTADLVGWDEHGAKATTTPWCHKCKTIVRAHGVLRASEAPGAKVEVWARCHGPRCAAGDTDTFRDRRARDSQEMTNAQLRAFGIGNLVFFAG